MNEEILTTFIQHMELLKNYFINCIHAMSAPYNTIEMTCQQDELMVDVFDYDSPRLPFQKPIFKSNHFPGKSLSFDVDSMNAPFGKLWLNAPEGNLNAVMAVDDITLQNGVWYYFPPIDTEINDDRDQSYATPINELFVRNVIKAAFSPESFNF